MAGPAPDGVVAILLAAGRGSRFDADESKLCQPFGPQGQAVAILAAQALLAVSPPLPVVAVVAREDALAVELRRLGCQVTLLDPESTTTPREMSASLRHGLACCADAAGWLVALADMPLVKPDTIARIAAALRNGADIAAPVMAGRRGHPVGFSRHHQAALLALTGDQGARAILASHAVTEVMVDDDGIGIDIDTPDDLARHRPR